MITIETHVRSVAKAVAYRFLGTATTVAVVFVLSGSLPLALWGGLFETVSKIILFYLHERLWEKIPFGRKKIVPPVIWLTGLPGAGKTTLSERLSADLRTKGFRVEQLDGDELRALLPSMGFDREARENHVMRVGLLARFLQKNGVCVIVSLVSPYRKSREIVRGLCENFIEVYVSTPSTVCEARDPKGMYAMARSGKIKSFTGVDDPYEPPVSPEVTIDTSVAGVGDCASVVITEFNKKAA